MQAFWVAMGTLSSMSLSLVSAAILSRYFDKAEYGTYKQILYVYNTLLFVFTAGLPRVFAYFLPRYELSEGKEIVWRLTKILFLLGLVFSATLFLSAGLIATILNNPALEIGLQYFSPIPMLMLPTLGIEGIFSTYKKTIYIAIYNALTRFLTLLFIVTPIILFENSYIYAIYGWILASILSLLIAFYFKSIPFKGIKTKVALLTNKEIFVYSLPLVVATIGGIAIKAADQFYISRYFGPETFAEFSNGFIQLPFVGMVTGAAAAVLMPLFSEIAHEKTDTGKLLELWNSALVKSAITIYPLVIFFIFHAKQVVIIIYSDLYIESAIYFQIAILLNFFNIILFTPLILALGKTKFYANMHLVFAGLAWAGGYIIITLFESPILIASFSIALSISMVLVAIIYSARLLNVTFWEMIPANKFLSILIHSFLSLSIIYFIVNTIFPEASNLLILLLDSIGFLILLLSTSKLFQLDYMVVIRPILNRFIK